MTDTPSDRTTPKATIGGSTLCRHCGRFAARIFPAAVCRRCWTQAGGVLDENDLAEPTPTDARPGTPEKVQVLAERYRKGQKLWHKEDAKVPQGPGQFSGKAEGGILQVVEKRLVNAYRARVWHDGKWHDAGYHHSVKKASVARAALKALLKRKRKRNK